MADDEAFVAALSYARRGWPVFPVAGVTVDGRCTCGSRCTKSGKHPLTPHGLLDASADEERLRAWGRRWRGANVGVATGPAAGIVVVDVDLDKGGEASLAELERRGLVLPATLTAHTGGGGLHLVYRDPDAGLRNTAGRLPGAGLLPGMDLRAAGGYVVVPPSRHASGVRYRWADPDVAPTPAPTWLRTPLRSAPAAPGLGQHLRVVGPGSAYGRAAMERELDELAATGAGARNHQLNRAAFVLGTLVGGGEIDHDIVNAELRRVGVAIGLGEQEVEATVASGLSAGEDRPRTAPRSQVQPGLVARKQPARARVHPPQSPRVGPGGPIVDRRGR